MLNFEQWSLWLLALAFAAAAAVVWFAGTRLAGYVDEISDRTGMGKGFAGLILLGGITSLPEVAVSVSSSLTGEEVLAVNNLLGSVASQVALLALADAVIGREALTSVVVAPVVLLQAALNIVLLAMVAAAVTTGDIALGPFGAWSLALLFGYAASIYALSGYENRTTWIVPHDDDDDAKAKSDVAGAPQPKQDGEKQREKIPLRGLVVRTTIAGALILAAGYVLSQTGSAAAAKTGLGSAFFGATFVAIATSLPEISTMVGAVRLKRYEMAMGDIFGTNLFNAALIFVTDALAPGDPLLGRVGAFSAFGALLGLVLTALFMSGLVERRDRTVFRMGWDSFAVLFTYAGGVVMLWLLRDQAGG
ncbi:MAG TPA: sodium:calcium antiporter [Falsiroseomonas sp.]|nr:sodium:calcium antiporter [Falsiroseomonas sp.]